MKNKSNSIFRVKEIPRLRKSSAPFLSGDTFMHIADYVFLKEFDLRYLVNLLDKVELELEQSKKILFIEVSALESSEIQNVLMLWLEKIYMNCKKNLTVLIHNGDQIPKRTFYETIVGSGAHVYSVNCTQEQYGVKPLPIGLENKHFHGNGIGRQFAISKDRKFHLNVCSDQSEEVFASFNISTNLDERSKTKKLIVESGHNFTVPNLTRKKYQASVGRSRFVISPPGNGLDCHRTWEAIYLGSVPVVLKKFLSEKLIEIFPIIAVNEWGEFLDLSSNERDVLVSRFDGMEYPAMAIDYWSNALRRSNEL